jgi:hypothetical protein
MSEKRWRATITYRSETGEDVRVFDVEEIEELQDIVEKGPAWACLIDIKIEAGRGWRDGPRTIEEAAKLERPSLLTVVH